MLKNLELFFIFFPVFLFSLSFHESAHAWTANRLGDPTARLMGRVSLNPLAHIDWIGTVIFPLMMFLMPGLLLFGWAKPVPVNPRNLVGGRKGHLRVAAAGPISNVILAFVFAGVLHVLVRLIPVYVEGSLSDDVMNMLVMGVYLNLNLALFNLIPIPPLDGSHILEGILPARQLHWVDKIAPYGMIIMIAGLYLGVFRYLAIPVRWVGNFLLP